MGPKKYKTKKIRTFLLFLALACIIWVLTKFSKSYTATISGNINYINLPENTVLGDGNPDKFSFEVTANGFKFLQYQLNTPEIDIPVANYLPNNNNRIIIERNELNRLIASELENEVSVKNLSLNQIIINLDTVASRMIPIRANIKIRYKEGFRAVDTALLNPNVVKVSAPANELNKIDTIRTKEISLTDVDKKVDLDLQLELPASNSWKVEPSTVKFSQEVKEFTQKKLNVPIEIVNLPPGIKVKIIPNSLTISFDVPMENFNNITATDFKVVCDYAKKDSADNFMVAEIIRQPEGILNVEVSEKKIDFLIFK
ncbi:hypothetical protein C5O00_10445 [Pukyongia salina]|uniref:YbbR-like protein n=1 Tax=Pukyongia salina TaxID=2094025 RepID=A0A2S0HY74_9FLAO|nr:YbbR-like domain-containing protein [Pukyongia salina]AVI51560.1 hypothetical protein C5O00_10445 [Pukyongia salina]